MLSQHFQVAQTVMAILELEKCQSNSSIKPLVLIFNLFSYNFPIILKMTTDIAKLNPFSLVNILYKHCMKLKATNPTHDCEPIHHMMQSPSFLHSTKSTWSFENGHGSIIGQGSIYIVYKLA